MHNFTREETQSCLHRAARYHLPACPQDVAPDWRNACLFCGVMDAWRATGEPRWIEAAGRWAKGNAYSTYSRPNFGKEILLDHFTVKGRLPWRYEDPEDYQMVHADFILCGKVYMELAQAQPQEAHDLSALLRALDFCAKDAHDDYWWWADAVHMALPVFHLASRVTGDARYADKGHRLYLHAREQLQDPDTMLWYRDWRFKPGGPDAGQRGKTFWARGNGWVYAGLVNTLAVMQPADPRWDVYRQDVLRMTPMVLSTMGSDGFWRSNLMEPDAHAMPESSGTLLFLTGLMRGIRLGILDAALAERCGLALASVSSVALGADGMIGYVQGVADRPGPVEAHNTHAYAAGYYFAACSEWLRWLASNGGM